jgi:hypothetical protein
VSTALALRSDPRYDAALADPFRTIVRRCALCDLEVPAEALATLAGVEACAGCREGELDRAIARWGLSCTARESQNGGSLHRSIEVLRPTMLDLAVKLEPDQRKGWFLRAVSGDPEVGDPEFDDHVLVAPADPSFAEATVAALRSQAVRQAILEATEQGAAVELAGRSVWVYASEHGGSETIPELAVIRPLGIALAVALERLARGHERLEPRLPSGHCELCGQGVSEPLESLAGLEACPRCRVWDEGRMRAHVGLACRTEHCDTHSVISVCSLAFDEYVLFERDTWLRRKLGLEDVVTGDRTFDDQVHVKPTAGDLGDPMARALQDEGVRGGILELLELIGRDGSITVEGRELLVRVRPRDPEAHASDKDAELACVKPLAVALVLAINRAS